MVVQARQRYRDEVIGTTRADLEAFGQRMQASFATGGNAKVVVVGSADAFEAAKAAGIELGVRQLVA